jgi:xanthine dehydrogenase YagR molybdenum-binding subunit
MRQGVVNHRNVLAQMLGVPKDKVRVVSKFLGSGFGNKLFPWTQLALAAAAARQLGKPIKFVVSRRMMFQSVGHRPRVSQRIRLSPTREGKLTSLRRDWVNHTSILDDYKENCARPRRSCTASQSAHYFGGGAAQRRLAHRHARAECGARPVGHRVGDGRVGAEARHGPGTTASRQRAEDR